MAYFNAGFTAFGSYKKIGGENIEARPVEPAADATGKIDIDGNGDVTIGTAALAGAGWIILEGEGQGAELAIPVFNVTRV
jgi:hypothetical protein